MDNEKKEAIAGADKIRANKNAVIMDDVQKSLEIQGAFLLTAANILERRNYNVPYKMLVVLRDASNTSRLIGEMIKKLDLDID